MKPEKKTWIKNQIVYILHHYILKTQYFPKCQASIEYKLKFCTALFTCNFINIYCFLITQNYKQQKLG